MKRLTKDTLRRVTQEFPTLDWADGELEELVTPRFGAITGFQRFLESVEQLVKIDLGETGMAGNIRGKTEEERPR